MELSVCCLYSTLAWEGSGHLEWQCPMCERAWSVLAALIIIILLIVILWLLLLFLSWMSHLFGGLNGFENSRNFAHIFVVREMYIFYWFVHGDTKMGSTHTSSEVHKHIQMASATYYFRRSTNKSTLWSNLHCFHSNPLWIKAKSYKETNHCPHMCMSVYDRAPYLGKKLQSGLFLLKIEIIVI